MLEHPSPPTLDTLMKTTIPTNTILQGDCLSLMQDLPDHSMDLVLCDLPYGITQNNWDRLIPLDKLWWEYRRIVKSTGYVILTAQGLFVSALMESNRRQFSHKIIWVKCEAKGFLNAKRMPLKIHEDILIFRMGKGAPYHPQFTSGHAPYKSTHPAGKYYSDNYHDNPGKENINYVKQSDGRRYPVDVLKFPTSPWDRFHIHPTQKPVEMGRYLIRQYSNPGAIVLDNCCGSGSFPVSALLENRRFLGMEASESYVVAARQRIQNIKDSQIFNQSKNNKP